MKNFPNLRKVFDELDIIFPKSVDGNIADSLEQMVNDVGVDKIVEAYREEGVCAAECKSSGEPFTPNYERISDLVDVDVWFDFCDFVRKYS